MRWFVEVSPVGDTNVDEKYCVEAKQWQAALQEARKLRGDSGPLSKFSIELLDDGYRAVDPKQKLRFVVAKAPPDAELTTESPRNGQVAHSVAPLPPIITSAPVAAPAPALVVAPASSAAPVAAPAPVTASAPAAPFAPVRAEPYAGVPSSHLSPNAPPSAVKPVAPTPSAFPPRPVTSVPRAPSVKPSANVAIPEDVIPPAPGLPKNLGPAVANQLVTQPSPAIELPPPSSILRKRQEEPTTESPIIYREAAYVVGQGVTRGSVEALLWAVFRDISRELAGRPEQKFVQLAVFDHSFEKRPERPPLGTLAWKDWRGNPVITFPFFDGTQPARASVPAPSIKPVPVVTISSSSAPSPASAAPAPKPASVPPPPAPAPVVSASAPPAPVVVVAPPPVAAPEPAPPVVVLTPQVEPAPIPTPAPPAALEPSAAIPLTREKIPSSHPSAGRSSRPRMAAVRRRGGEDLIGELFETMHDLHFMQNVADGSEFALAALDSVLPCDAVLIHVFDINRGVFVVTRAKGPGAIRVLLHETPDTDPFFSAVMRGPRSVLVPDVNEDPRLLGPRWETLGVQPRRALCGPVRQGGRYLGLVEVANPMGDVPFHPTEQNALDYICEQLAEFLVNRPIVLEADVILRR